MIPSAQVLPLFKSDTVPLLDIFSHLRPHLLHFGIIRIVPNIDLGSIRIVHIAEELVKGVRNLWLGKRVNCDISKRRAVDSIKRGGTETGRQ